MRANLLNFWCCSASTTERQSYSSKCCGSQTWTINQKPSPSGLCQQYIDPLIMCKAFYESASWHILSWSTNQSIKIRASISHPLSGVNRRMLWQMRPWLMSHATVNRSTSYRRDCSGVVRLAWTFIWLYVSLCGNCNQLVEDKEREKHSDQVVPVLLWAKALIRHDILAVTLNTANYL